MKKIVIIPLLLLAAVQLKAQSVIFKPAYLPKTTYTITKDMKMNMDMDMGGLAAATATPAPKNMAMVMNMNSTAEITTGGADNTHTFPIKISSATNSIKMTMNGQELPANNMQVPTVNMYGKYQTGGKLSLDSIAGLKMNDSVKIAMQKLVENIQNNIKFPDHALKVGDTFTQDAPFALPMMGVGNSSNMTVKMNYTLTSIANNIAVFDFTESINMDLDQAAKTQNVKVTMTGLGSGTLNYDVTKQFFAAMTNNLTMDFNINTAGMAMKGKAAVLSTDKAIIAAN